MIFETNHHLVHVDVRSRSINVVANYYKTRVTDCRTSRPQRSDRKITR